MCLSSDGPPPPLSKKEGKGENDKSWLCDLAGSRGGPGQSFPSEGVTVTGGKRPSALQSPWDASGTESCFLCELGVGFSILRLAGGTQRRPGSENRGSPLPPNRSLLALLTACLVTKKRKGRGGGHASPKGASLVLPVPDTPSSQRAGWTFRERHLKPGNHSHRGRRKSGGRGWGPPCPHSAPVRQWSSLQLDSPQAGP